MLWVLASPQPRRSAPWPPVYIVFALIVDLSGKSLPCRLPRTNVRGNEAMEHAPDAELIALGREFARARRRYRRLRKGRAGDWTAWSAAMEEATELARRVGRVRPVSPSGLLVRYEAVVWLLLEQDDAIVDDEGRRAFLAFGRALRRLVARQCSGRAA